MNEQPISVAKFRLGRVVTTPKAVETLTHDDILRGIIRHQSGDWGEMEAEDCEANNQALIQGTRLFSQFRSARDIKFWIITEADRSATTVLLPEEY